MAAAYENKKKPPRPFLALTIKIAKAKKTLTTIRNLESECANRTSVSVADIMAIGYIPRLLQKINDLESELVSIPRRGREAIEADIESQRAEIIKIRSKKYNTSSTYIPADDWLHGDGDDDDYAAFWDAGADRAMIETIETMYIPTLMRELLR